MPFLNRIGSGSTSKFGFSKGFRPGVPTSVTASLPNTFGNTTAFVSWTAPLTVGAPALHDYQIQYSDNNGASFTTFGDAVSTATTVTVTGLTNGFAYVFRVRAINQIGIGNFSANSNSVIPLNSKIPTPTFNMDDDTQGRVGINFTNYLGNSHPFQAFPGGGYFYNYFNCGGGFCPNDIDGTSHGWVGLPPDTERSAFLKVQRFGYADSDTVFCAETSPSAPAIFVEPVTTQPPPATTQPPPATTQPPPVTTQPPATTQPPPATTAPPSTDGNPCTYSNASFNGASGECGPCLCFSLKGELGSCAC